MTSSERRRDQNARKIFAKSEKMTSSTWNATLVDRSACIKGGHRVAVIMVPSRLHPSHDVNPKVNRSGLVITLIKLLALRIRNSLS